ncbi:hypothetical protein Tco_0695210 [Tanacetum coccineum]
MRAKLLEKPSGQFSRRGEVGLRRLRCLLCPRLRGMRLGASLNTSMPLILLADLLLHGAQGADSRNVAPVMSLWNLHLFWGCVIHILSGAGAVLVTDLLAGLGLVVWVRWLGAGVGDS